MANDKCDKIYSQVLDANAGGNTTLFDLAQCFISGYDIDKLSNMLKSHDDGVVLDGLFVCKEIGDLVCKVKESLLPLERRQDIDVRTMASEVVAICRLYDC